MSNTLTNLVPSFNGKDFKSYAKKMEAYLAFQGIDNVLTEDKPSPVTCAALPQAPARSPGSLRLVPDAVGDPPVPAGRDSPPHATRSRAPHIRRD
ncbi:hypothetical protein EV122DRAFT_285477 [Schizophyllum commune]